MPDDGLSVDIETSGTHAATDRDVAGDPRCRSDGPHHRPHRQYQPRPRHRGGDARAQAQYRQRRFRNPGYSPQAVARAHSASASTARCRRRPRCWRATRCATAPGSRSIPRRAAATIAAQVALAMPIGKNAPENCDDLCHHRRPHQFRRRQAADGAEGRSLVAAGDRVERRLPDQRRRQDQRHAGQHRSEQEKGAPNADLRMQATIDEAARRRLGVDLGGAVTGAIPVKLDGAARRHRQGRADERRGRSHAGEDRQSAAGLGQARRQAGARHLHAGPRPANRRYRRSRHRRVRAPM